MPETRFGHGGDATCTLLQGIALGVGERCVVARDTAERQPGAVCGQDRLGLPAGSQRARLGLRRAARVAEAQHTVQHPFAAEDEYVARGQRHGRVCRAGRSPRRGRRGDRLGRRVVQFRGRRSRLDAVAADEGAPASTGRAIVACCADSGHACLGARQRALRLRDLEALPPFLRLRRSNNPPASCDHFFCLFEAAEFRSARNALAQGTLAALSHTAARRGRGTVMPRIVAGRPHPGVAARRLLDEICADVAVAADECLEAGLQEALRRAAARLGPSVSCGARLRREG